MGLLQDPSTRRDHREEDLRDGVLLDEREQRRACEHKNSVMRIRPPFRPVVRLRPLLALLSLKCITLLSAAIASPSMHLWR